MPASIPRIPPPLPPVGTDDDPRLGSRITTSEDTEADVVLLGCPDDTGIRNSGGRTGAVEAPPVIRHWLYRLTTGMHDELSRIRIRDLGDVEPGDDIGTTHHRLEELVATQIGDAPVIVLGGGHDLAYASQSGVLRGIDGTAAILNLDAHLDVRPLRDGTVVTSGTPFRRLMERWKERLARIVELGIQSQHNASSHVEWARQRGVEIHTLEALRESPGVSARMKEKLDGMAEEVDIVTISLDLDTFAAAFAPGVSAPPADGFQPADVLPFLEHAGRNPKVRLLEILELSPRHDVDDRTSRLAALLIWRFLVGVAARPKRSARSS